MTAKTRLISALLLATLLLPTTVCADTEGDYTYTVTDGKATITDFNTAYSGSLIIPSTLGGYPITSIGEGSFYNCASLTSVTIPDSVTSIGYKAFFACKALTAVTIPASVTNIGFSAFSSCTSLTSVIIPDSITSIGDYAFSFCTLLTSVTIPDSVTSIGGNAFSYCTKLTSVIIPDSVTSIGYSAFGNCTSLTSVTIPDSVTSIGDDAFNSCESLTSVLFTGDAPATIGSHVFSSAPTTVFYFPGTFGWGATFSGCPAKPLLAYAEQNGTASITDCDPSYNGHVPLPDTIAGLPVTSIGSYAFFECNSLVSVTIPDSVTYIGDDAFNSCTSLTSITIPDSVTSIGYKAFGACYSLTSVTIPDSVTNIGGSAFSFCTSLTAVNISDSVTSIGYSAFLGCTSLTAVNIPDSVNYIGEWAFSYCYSLTSIFFAGDVPTIGASAFDYTPVTIYYLPGANGWATPINGLTPVCWNPAFSPAAPLAFTSGQFGFTLTGNANIPVRIQACDNLASPSWSTVASTTLNASGTLSFSDPASASAPSRFYRITFPQ